MIGGPAWAASHYFDNVEQVGADVVTGLAAGYLLLFALPIVALGKAYRLHRRYVQEGEAEEGGRESTPT